MSGPTDDARIAGPEARDEPGVPAWSDSPGGLGEGAGASPETHRHQLPQVSRISP